MTTATAFVTPPTTVFRPALAPPVNLNGKGHYLHWGLIQVSVANIVVLTAIIAVFVLALLAPFPGSKGRDTE